MRAGVFSRGQHRSDRVGEIEVKVGDARGRRSRHDSHCIRRVKLHGTSAAGVVDVGGDVYSAIDRDTDRACRLAEEQLRLAGSPHATQTAVLAA